MEKRYYIAYGSNLNIPQMRMRCPGARIIGTSVIEGYRLLFKGSRTGSYLTIEPQEGAGVPVAAWAVTEEDEAALDRYEGCGRFSSTSCMRTALLGFRENPTWRPAGRATGASDSTRHFWNRRMPTARKGRMDFRVDGKRGTPAFW